MSEHTDKVLQDIGKSSGFREHVAKTLFGNDYISRQAAIEAFYVQSDDDGWWCGTAQDAEELLKGLPSTTIPTKCVAKIEIDADTLREIVDSVIVRCKDCTRQCICFHNDDYFCSEGERIKR